MQWYIADRRRGKTTAIIEWWKESQSRRYIVVANERQREFLVKEICGSFATALEGLTVQQQVDRVIEHIKRHVVTPRSLSTLGYEDLNVELGFDNIEMVLATLFRAPVGFVTGTQRDPFIRMDEGSVRIDSRS